MNPYLDTESFPHESSPLKSSPTRHRFIQKKIRLAAELCCTALAALLSIAIVPAVQAQTGTPIILTVAGGNNNNIEPTAVAVDAAGNLYIATYNQIDEVTASTGVIATIAGQINGVGGYSGDGGPATLAALNGPEGVAVDSAGNIYFSDTHNNVIRKVTASTGKITTVAGHCIPTGVSNNPCAAGYAGDGGPARQAKLNLPTGIALDSAGNIYFSDTFNSRIREVTASTGIIATVAGDGQYGYSGDGGPATSASLAISNEYYPAGVAVDSADNIYIADTYNGVVRKVTASTGIITTVVRDALDGYLDYYDHFYPQSYGGWPVTSRFFSDPTGIAVDAAGNIYVADASDNLVRKWTAATGVNSTVAGDGYSAAGYFPEGLYAGDGGPADQTSLYLPEGVAVDASGNIYIADTLDFRVREVVPSDTNFPTLITWPTPAPITYGTPVTSTQLDATVSEPGNLIYAPTLSSAGMETVLPAGTFPLKVFFVPAQANVPPETATVQLVVNKATLTVSGSNSVQVGYGNNNLGTIPYGFTITGFQYADNYTSVVSGAPTITPSWGTNPAVGSYVLDVSAEFLSSPNYTFQTVNGSVTVTPAVLTIKPDNATIMYGQAIPTLNYVVAGLKYGQTASVLSGSPQLSTTATATSGVGSYPIWANVSGVTAPNYTVVAGPQAQLTVNPVKVQVKPLGTAIKVGDPIPTFQYTFSGFVNGDTSAVVSGTPTITTTAVQGSPAGVYPIMLSVGGISAPNYLFDPGPNANLVIK